ncbi:MFS transporter [Marinicella sp. W31]|uniref:MFS transporter n=1 Tax=Marinicella sp. W31 TaxID=3023713 RepID=UPI0037570057
MNSIERKAAFSIALLVALRMYGLFLIIPVFSIYARQIPGATDFLVGIAIGVYGLTQAGLQIPMGFLSDVIGRRKVIAIGLLIFIIGSVIAALASDIWWIIIGRAIQGSGAIASTGMALIADVSRAEQRSKVMGIVGASIGLAFMLSFITGPILAAWFGVKGLFWITAGLAGIALLQLFVFVEEPEKTHNQSFKFSEWLQTIQRKELLFLDMAVFLLHASLTAIFVILPIMLVDFYQLETQSHWRLYLPALLLSLLIMVPMIILQEKGSGRHTVFIAMGLAGLGVSTVLLGVIPAHFLMLLATMILYFGFFNFLEASMPSFLSKLAGTKYRGAAMGVFSSSQFLGAFAGGAYSGWAMGYGFDMVFMSIAVCLVLCALLSYFLLGTGAPIPQQKVSEKD